MLFFFKRKTAYEMRISDWSSDVCSSDLGLRRAGRQWYDPDGSGRPAALRRRRLFAERQRRRGQLHHTRQGHADLPHLISAQPPKERTEERRVGKKCVSTCRSRWSPYNTKKNHTRQRTEQIILKQI